MYIFDEGEEFAYVQIAFGWMVPTGAVPFEMRDPTLREQFTTKMQIDNILQRAGVHPLTQGIFTAPGEGIYAGQQMKYFVVTALHPAQAVNKLIDEDLDPDTWLSWGMDDVIRAESGAGVNWKVFAQAYTSEPYPNSILTGDHPARHIIQIDGDAVVVADQKLIVSP